MTWVNFQTVRQELDFSEVLSHYGFETKANGKHQVKIHCPFHDDANPSCGVNLDKKVFNCFSCHTKGNILDFFAMMEGLEPSNTRDLRKAALMAVETFRIDGGASEAKSGDQPKAKARMKGQKLASGGSKSATNPEGKEIKEPGKRASGAPSRPVNSPLTFELQLDTKHPFLKKRGIGKKQIREFGLGYAGRGSMKGRICFPIHNQAGELIAYSGRWVGEGKPKDIPRYLLPKGFEKSQVLYNLNRVVTSESATSTIVIVEGFWSVLRLHAAGIPVVSTFGGSVSGAQIDLLVQAEIDRCVLIFDGDEGGRLGIEQALPVLASRLFVQTIPLADGVKPDTMADDILNALPRYVRS